MNNPNNIDPTDIHSLNNPQGKSWLKQLSESSTPLTKLTINDDGLIPVDSTGTILAPWAAAANANAIRESLELNGEDFGKMFGVSNQNLSKILVGRNYFSSTTFNAGSGRLACNPLDAHSDSDKYKKMCKFMVDRINGMEDGEEKRRFLSLFRPTNCQVSPYPDTEERLTTIQDAFPNFGPPGDTSFYDLCNGTAFSKKEQELFEKAIEVYTSTQLPGCDITLLQFMGKLTDRSTASIGHHSKCAWYNFR